jgi:hypothetical protein
MTMLRKALVILAATVPLALHPAVAGASSGSGADWEMNEPPGATVMHDSAGIDNSAVIKSGVIPEGTFYHFTGQNGLVVPNSPELNPGTRDFDIYVTFRQTSHWAQQSLIQKGRWNQAGGQYKVNIDGTGIKCRIANLWNTVNRNLAVNTWHTIGCLKRSDRTILTIDGKVARTLMVPGGFPPISTTVPVEIGGKSVCPGGDCDLFKGDLDSVTLSYP